MKFSIIVPCYNVRAYVGQCLDSVLALRNKDWECLCIDDGSPDGLGEVLDEYARKDPRFRAFHVANAGVGAARNLGIENAKGDWMLFLDGDDVLAPWILDVVEVAEQNDSCADMVGFGYRSFPEDESLTWVQQDAGTRLGFRSIDLTHSIGMDAVSGQLWTRAYRRVLVGNLRFPCLMKGQDLVFFMKATLNASRLVRCDCPCVGYRQRASSTMHAPMTSRKLFAEIEYARLVVEAIANTEKSIQPSVIRIYVNAMLEKTAYDFRSLSDRNVASDFWNRWYGAAETALKCTTVNGFQRFRLRIVMWLRIHLFARLFFELPYWLKIKGLHR